MSILREEAAREAAERRAEAERSLHVQTDLGLAEGNKRPAPHPEPQAAPEPDAEPESPRTRPPSRRSLLPDIEEINSTLRPGAEQRGDDPPAFTEAAERRKGFSAGFLTVMLFAVALALLYGFAPQLARAVPSLQAPLDGYVAAVDAARIWLDETLHNATGALQGLSGEGAEPQG